MTPDFDPGPAMAVLKADATLAQDPDYLGQAEARLGGSRTPDDHREAAKLAAEAAKMILTVDIAGLVAVGTFLQFARNGGVPWLSCTIGLLGLAALAATIAAGAGFTAISKIYKRADGREGAKDTAWGTDVAVRALNLQAAASLVALGAFIGGLVCWASDPSPRPPKSIDCELSLVGEAASAGMQPPVTVITRNGSNIVITRTETGIEAKCS